MAATALQLSCFSATNRGLQLQRRSFPCQSLRLNLSVVMRIKGRDTDIAWFDAKNTPNYTTDKSKLHVEEKQKLYSTIEDHDAVKTEKSETVPELRRTAKNHDFSLGIPFGGFVLSGGITVFIFSRSPATLSNEVLFGGALLFLSTISLKVWRQGKSSVPFVLGQAALSGVLIWKNFQAYSWANKAFPYGFIAIISSAMLCFHLYVLLSGGSPPPKKSSVSIAS